MTIMHIYRIEQVNNLSQIMQVNLKQIKSASDRNKYVECRIYHEIYFSFTLLSLSTFP